VLDEVHRRVTRPGVICENKGPTASIHYRLADQPDKARQEVLEVLATCAQTSGLRLEEGRMVLNLLPPLTVTKGSAVTWLARDRKLTRLVYLGDDVTDAHAFRALKALQESGAIRTLSIGVVGSETPAQVRQLADATVPSVHDVADLLCQVAQGLRQAGDRMEAGVASVRRETYGQPTGHAHD
jgi:trehalose 6-phosphate phosphatase